MVDFVCTVWRIKWIGAMIMASKFDASEHAMKLLPINCLQLNAGEWKENDEIPIHAINMPESDKNSLGGERASVSASARSVIYMFLCIQFEAISPTRYRYLVNKKTWPFNVIYKPYLCRSGWACMCVSMWRDVLSYCMDRSSVYTCFFFRNPSTIKKKHNRGCCCCCRWCMFVVPL